MSRGAFLIGLCLSVALHAWLVMQPAPEPRTEQNQSVQEVSVMETERARPEPKPPPQAEKKEEESEKPKPEEKEPEKTEPEQQQESEQDPPEQPEPPEQEQQPEPPEPKTEPEKEPEPDPPQQQPEPGPEPQSEKPEPQPSPDTQEKEESPDRKPNLEKVDEPEPADEKIQGRGDLAGRPSDEEAEPSPQLRINWGAPRRAQQVLEAGGMKLVVLKVSGSRPEITHQLRNRSGSWERRIYQRSGTTMFSNRLRIVDEVPAFDAVRRAVQIKPNERLAVLVPTEVERKLESAQLHAASKRGLSMKRVRYFAGRFRLRNGDLGFEITGVQRRSPTQ